MSKYDGIIKFTDQQLIESTVSAMDELSEVQKINLAESLECIVYLHPRFWNMLGSEKKLSSLLVIATIIQTIEESNSLAFSYLMRAFDCYNNNIFYTVKGGAANV